MPEMPWFKCYPQDALSDQGIKRCAESTRGIWFFAWFTMKQKGTYKLEGTAKDLASDCCTSVDLLLAALDDLKRTGTADITDQDGNITLTCRRLLREAGISDLRRKAGIASAAKRQQHSQQTVPTPSASASVSASASASASGEEGSGGKPNSVAPATPEANVESKPPAKAVTRPSPATVKTEGKRALTDRWCTAFLDKNGFAYVFQGAKDGKAADALLKSGLTVDQIIALAESAWGSDGFWSKQAATLAGFASRINEIRFENSKPTNGATNIGGSFGCVNRNTTPSLRAAALLFQSDKLPPMAVPRNLAPATDGAHAGSQGNGATGK